MGFSNLQRNFLVRLKIKCSKENRLLLRILGGNKKRIEKRVIGLAGLCAGAGTTHLSLMTGNYLANGLGIKVAVILLGEDNTFNELVKYVDYQYNEGISGSEKRNKIRSNLLLKYHGLTFNGMDIYKCNRSGTWQIFKDYYDYLILDFSSTNEKKIAMPDFMACNKKILVSSMTPYKLRECIERTTRIKRMLEGELIWVSQTYNLNQAKKLEKDLEVIIKVIPNEPDLIRIDGKHLKWLDELVFAQ